MFFNLTITASAQVIPAESVEIDSLMGADSVAAAEIDSLVKTDLTVDLIDSSAVNADSAGVDTIETAESETISDEDQKIPLDSLKIRRHNPSLAMWKSLILPGWGQLYNKKYLKTVIIGGAEIALIYGIFYQHDQSEKAQKAGDSEAANFYRDDRNRLTWWLAGIILYSMADAYVDAQLMDFDLSNELSLGIAPGKLFVRLQF